MIHAVHENLQHADDVITALHLPQAAVGSALNGGQVGGEQTAYFSDGNRTANLHRNFLQAGNPTFQRGDVSSVASALHLGGGGYVGHNVQLDVKRSLICLR